MVVKKEIEVKREKQRWWDGDRESENVERTEENHNYNKKEVRKTLKSNRNINWKRGFLD